MNRSFMSLLKNNSGIFLAASLLVSNYWMIKIFNLNILLAISLMALSLIVIIGVKKKLILTLGMTILLLLQFYTTDFINPTYLDNDQQRVQQERIRSYGLTYVDLYFKVIWLKPAEWIEQNKFVIVLSRFEENFFEALDINYYFFGGFPRNNTFDYEKFPFIVLPFFIAGLFKLVEKKEYFNLTLIFLVPVMVLSVIGMKNPYGAFVLFPSIVYCSREGILFTAGFFKSKNIFYSLLVLFFLIFLYMQINYAAH